MRLFQRDYQEKFKLRRSNFTQKLQSKQEVNWKEIKLFLLKFISWEEEELRETENWESETKSEE